MGYNKSAVYITSVSFLLLFNPHFKPVLSVTVGGGVAQTQAQARTVRQGSLASDLAQASSLPVLGTL